MTPRRPDMPKFVSPEAHDAEETGNTRASMLTPTSLEAWIYGDYAP